MYLVRPIISKQTYGHESVASEPNVSMGGRESIDRAKGLARV